MTMTAATLTTKYRRETFLFRICGTLSFLALLPIVSAHASMHSKRDSNGMDMSMDGAMDLASGAMTTWFHFTIANPSEGTAGDILWFEGWVPQGPGPMFGACVGLFLLAIVERWIAAVRAGWEGFWVKRDRVTTTNARNSLGVAGAGATKGEVWKTIMMRKGYVPSFLVERDIVRGTLHIAKAALAAAFMLSVMTYQVGFILAIVIGEGVGECLFGRYMQPLRA